MRDAVVDDLAPARSVHRDQPAEQMSALAGARPALSVRATIVRSSGGAFLGGNELKWPVSGVRDASPPLRAPGDSKPPFP